MDLTIPSTHADLHVASSFQEEDPASHGQNLIEGRRLRRLVLTLGKLLQARGLLSLYPISYLLEVQLRD